MDREAKMYAVYALADLELPEGGRLTQRQIAKQVGEPQSNVSYWLSKRRELQEKAEQ